MTSSRVTGQKESKIDGLGESPMSRLEEGEMFALMLAAFSIK